MAAAAWEWVTITYPEQGVFHHLINRSTTEATYIEIGDRQSGDRVSYPRDDLVAVRAENGWAFTHKDGAPYD